MLDLHADPPSTASVIRTDLPHLKLDADVEGMSPEERTHAAGALREALAQLQPPSTEAANEREPMAMDG